MEQYQANTKIGHPLQATWSCITGGPYSPVNTYFDPQSLDDHGNFQLLAWQEGQNWDANHQTLLTVPSQVCRLTLPAAMNPNARPASLTSYTPYGFINSVNIAFKLDANGNWYYDWTVTDSVAFLRFKDASIH